MATSLTPQEYEMELESLRDSITAYIERGEGEYKRIRRRAEELLLLRHEFPEVYARHEDIEGIIADLLAREKQKEFMSWYKEEEEAPGCLVGWLFRRKEE